MAEETETRVPFFIVGSPRSGTTMFRLMLNAHPNLAVPFETAFLWLEERIAEFGDLGTTDAQRRALEALMDERMTKKGEVITDPDAILGHRIESFADLIDAMMREYARRHGKQRWGVKTPHYVEHIDDLWRLFPGSRFIHVVRDGRDVALSLSTLSWGSSHIPTLAADWHWLVTLGHKMGSMIPASYMVVRFEDLVAEPEAVLRRVCTFLDEPYDEQMLAYHVDAEQAMPAESMQWHASSVAPPMQEKVHGWKTAMSQADQILYEEIAGSTLERFGYELTGRAPTLASRIRRAYYCFVRRG